MKLQNKIAIVVFAVTMPFMPMLAQGNAMAYAPVIPEKVHFADRVVDLDRIDFYERMDREMISFAFGHTNTLLTIKRANRYAPGIVKILKEQGVPEDLVYLAAIESHYDNAAVSSAKAVGMWQFMPSTAKEYGLEVNEYVDERLDCDKSTVAACKYFKRAYAKYKCWLTVAAAYNAGMGRISKSLETQDVEHALDLYLNKETSRYIFRLLAMKLIIENPARYGYAIKVNQLYQPLDCDTFVVAEPVKDWVQWSKEHNITYSLLREYNPWIRSVSLPNPNNKTYVVKIPKETSLYRSKQTLKTYRENWTR